MSVPVARCSPSSSTHLASPTGSSKASLSDDIRWQISLFLPKQELHGMVLVNKSWHKVVQRLIYDATPLLALYGMNPPALRSAFLVRFIGELCKLEYFNETLIFKILQASFPAKAVDKRTEKGNIADDSSPHFQGIFMNELYEKIPVLPVGTGLKIFKFLEEHKMRKNAPTERERNESRYYVTNWLHKLAQLEETISHQFWSFFFDSYKHDVEKEILIHAGWFGMLLQKSLLRDFKFIAGLIDGVCDLRGRINFKESLFSNCFTTFSEDERKIKNKQEFYEALKLFKQDLVSYIKENNSSSSCKKYYLNTIKLEINMSLVSNIDLIIQDYRKISSDGFILDMTELAEFCIEAKKFEDAQKFLKAAENELPKTALSSSAVEVPVEQHAPFIPSSSSAIAVPIPSLPSVISEEEKTNLGCSILNLKLKFDPAGAIHSFEQMSLPDTALISHFLEAKGIVDAYIKCGETGKASALLKRLQTALEGSKEWLGKKIQMRLELLERVVCIVPETWIQLKERLFKEILSRDNPCFIGIKPKLGFYLTAYTALKCSAKKEEAQRVLNECLDDYERINPAQVIKLIEETAPKNPQAILDLIISESDATWKVFRLLIACNSLDQAGQGKWAKDAFNLAFNLSSELMEGGDPFMGIGLYAVLFLNPAFFTEAIDELELNLKKKIQLLYQIITPPHSRFHSIKEAIDEKLDYNQPELVKRGKLVLAKLVELEIRSFNPSNPGSGSVSGLLELMGLCKQHDAKKLCKEILHHIFQFAKDMSEINLKDPLFQDIEVSSEFLDRIYDEQIRHIEDKNEDDEYSKVERKLGLTLSSLMDRLSLREDRAGFIRLYHAYMSLVEAFKKYEKNGDGDYIVPGSNLLASIVDKKLWEHPRYDQVLQLAQEIQDPQEVHKILEQILKHYFSPHDEPLSLLPFDVVQFEKELAAFVEKIVKPSEIAEDQLKLMFDVSTRLKLPSLVTQIFERRVELLSKSKEEDLFKRLDAKLDLTQEALPLLNRTRAQGIVSEIRGEIESARALQQDKPSLSPEQSEKLQQKIFPLIAATDPRAAEDIIGMMQDENTRANMIIIAVQEIAKTKILAREKLQK